jgi:hypothetical protein
LGDRPEKRFDVEGQDNKEGMITKESGKRISHMVVWRKGAVNRDKNEEEEKET